MSASNASASSAFDAEAFRQRLAARASPVPSVSGESVSAGGYSRQPSPLPLRSGRRVPPAVATSGTTARAGVLSRGGLSGKSSTYSVTLVPSEFCRGIVKSNVFDDIMCIKSVHECHTFSHRTSKVEDFGGAIYCLEVGTRQWGMISPVIKQSDCDLDFECELNGMEVDSVEEWVAVCREAEERAKAKQNVIKVEVDGVEWEEDVPPIDLKEVCPIPARSKVDVEASVEAVKTGAVTDALIDLMEFVRSADMAFEYANISVSDLTANQHTMTDKLEHLVQMSIRVAKAIGDREFIRNEFGTVAQAIHDLGANCDYTSTQVEDIDIKLDELDKALDEKILIANEEQAKSLNRVKDELSRSSNGSADVSAVLDHNGRIHPDLEFGMVDGEIIDVKSLIRRVVQLEKDMKDIRRVIEAKGGVGLGNIYFKSLDNLKDTIRREFPSGVPPGSISCFGDAVTFFCAGKEPSTSDQTDYKKLNPALTPKDCAVIAQCQSTMVPEYTGTAKKYVSGARIDCFANADGWNGECLDSNQSRIAEAATEAVSKLNGVAPSILANAPTLLSLALDMSAKSEKWHVKFHSHLEKEIKILKKLKLPEDDVLLLFSDLFRLIVELWHTERATVNSIGDSVDPVDRLANIIWTSLKVHGLMQDFIDAKFKNHAIVQAAFVRFLTTKIGQNTTAALSTEVKDLDKKVTAATKQAKNAESTAKSVSDTLTKLKNKNPQWHT